MDLFRKKKSDLETPEIICVLSAILRMIHFLAKTIPQEHVYPIIVKFWYTTFGHNTAFLLASKSKTAKQKIVLANALLTTTTNSIKTTRTLTIPKIVQVAHSLRSPANTFDLCHTLLSPKTPDYI